MEQSEFHCLPEHLQHFLLISMDVLTPSQIVCSPITFTIRILHTTSGNVAQELIQW